MIIEIIDLTSTLDYNGDVGAQGDPEPVAHAKRRSGGLTFCSSPSPTTTTLFRRAENAIGRAPRRHEQRHAATGRWSLWSMAGMTGRTCAQRRLNDQRVFTSKRRAVSGTNLLVRLRNGRSARLIGHSQIRKAAQWHSKRLDPRQATGRIFLSPSGPRPAQRFIYGRR